MWLLRDRVTPRHAELLTTDMLRLFSQTKLEMEAAIYNLQYLKFVQKQQQKVTGREKDNVASCSWTQN